jgi:hypothetical protein
LPMQGQWLHQFSLSLAKALAMMASYGYSISLAIP